MSGKNAQLSKLLARKKILESKLTELKQAKKKMGIATLLEGELERAELVLAAQDVLDRLQKMAEDLAKMGTEDIMPLTDQIKEQYGPNMSVQFTNVANESINAALEAVKSAKDSINTEIVKMEGKIGSGGDAASGEGSDLASDTATGDEGLGDAFGGAEAAASSPNAGPLGREKR